jgi:steroid delta-isomerase-like uncharacterized protein
MDNRDILNKHIEAFTKGDWTTYRSLFADNAVYDEEATQQVFNGPDQITRSQQAWKTAFPDVKATIRNTVATGDAVVAEVEWNGTHNGTLTGPMGSIPASGRRGKVAAVLVARFENGKIREIRHYFDLMTILSQIGAAPRATQPTAP